ncbi:MAG TPA: PDZ domain-containing protein [Thermoanaerobaculia bacterium]|jgi:membrane-associated protease RseP (regulator of RpoE activity)
MLKKPWMVTLLALVLAIPAAAVLSARGGPEEDRVIVLSDEGPDGHNFDFDTDFDFDVDVDGGDPVVVRVGGKGGGFLGVQLIGITPELREHYGVARDTGILVGGVEADSPAAKAGIQVGDVLTSVDGSAINSTRDLSRAIRRKKAGDSVQLDLTRNRAKKQVTATLAERPAREIRVGELQPKMKKHAWVWKDGDFGKDFGPMGEMGQLEDRLNDLEKRMKDLEQKMRK